MRLIQCTEHRFNSQSPGSIPALSPGGAKARRKGTDGESELVPECRVPGGGPVEGGAGGGECWGPFSLRYRSSATFPLAVCSSSSRRFCLWKKPSCSGKHRRGEEQTRDGVKLGSLMVTRVLHARLSDCRMLVFVFSYRLLQGESKKKVTLRTEKHQIPFRARGRPRFVRVLVWMGFGSPPVRLYSVNKWSDSVSLHAEFTDVCVRVQQPPSRTYKPFDHCLQGQLKPVRSVSRSVSESVSQSITRQEGFCFHLYHS